MKNPKSLHVSKNIRPLFYLLTGLISTILVGSLSTETSQNTFAQLSLNNSIDFSSFANNETKFDSSIYNSTNSSTSANPITMIQDPPLSSQVPSTSNYEESLISLASYAIEKRLEKPKAILEVLSKLPEVQNFSFVNHVNKDEVPGIPAEDESEKRQIARYILSNHPMDFVSVLFLLPNGDVYLLEPFARQQNLSTNNLSFRDYYQGVISTNDAYLGNVITSAASGLKQVQLAVPLYAESSFNETYDNRNTPSQSNITGILSTGLNLQLFTDILNIANNGGNSNDDSNIVLMDGNGTIITQSSKNSTNLFEGNDGLIADLKSYKLALNGENGTMVEEIGGIERKISYTPVKAISNTWALLLIK
ncbi:cache domain-containing protein [Candidatus Nitrosocosmicus franklandus]|uniref:Sensor protein n=1 Tax=Candidatus Nitrosocosmicus franklandianus TaxID=1798806 RepID=A0A484IE77_9ARCH|nr:cache domain-containing protein [Candidatus Nitrosocosmicus franklandus]VFJ14379.1 Putative sensor protein [Candidatus Nitrosocosmicus franklandus]